MIAWVARLCLRHPWRMRGLLIALLVFGLGFIALQPRFESEILNLLPGSSSAVQGLKKFYTDFEQARELALVLRDPDVNIHPERLADFADFLGERLSSADWVVRWLEGSPMENPVARASLPAFITPLLFQLPPGETATLIAGLDRSALENRFATIAARLRSGSPAAQVQWQLDPLGLYASAIPPVLETTAAERTFAPSANAENLRIFTILTNQSDLSEPACTAMMQTVGDFLEETKRDFGLSPDAPIEILVTGRSAYVAEISTSMRRDILLTSVASIGSISFLFWLVYRRLSILFGLALILVVCSVLALALGLTLFPSLNLIAIAFCSILFGLGQDFGLLLYQEARRSALEPGLPPDERTTRLATAIRHRWPGIACVALTTALGFLALLAGESPGFAQLGVLTALGVGLAALLVPMFLFAFLGGRASPQAVTSTAASLPAFLLQPGRAYFLLVSALLLAALMLVLSPWRPLRFDLSPSSLEPRDLPAAQALEVIMQAFPDSSEPSLILLPLPQDETAAFEQARQLENTLRSWQQEGRITGFSIGSRLLLPRNLAQENLTLWQNLDFPVTRTNLLEAAATAGLRLPTDSPALAQLDALENFLRTSGDTISRHPWRNTLPANSPWWFILDRLISRPPDSPGTLVAFFQPASESAPSTWQAELQAAFPGAILTGWSVTIRSLVSWAERELRLFGFGVAGVIILVLFLVYRQPLLWLIHLLGLAAAAVLFLAALKLLDQPINLLGVLGFPLLIGVGVDYSTHLLLALRKRDAENLRATLDPVLTPILMAGLTTMAGFGALALAANPALRGLGLLCALGVSTCLLSTFAIVLPLATKLPRPRK
jgi:predicted RND superfamily exporter protein